MTPFDAATDRALLAAARRSPAAWRDVFLLQFDPVYRYCALRGCDAEAAERVALAVLRRAAGAAGNADDSAAPLIMRLLSIARDLVGRAGGKPTLPATLPHPTAPPAQMAAARRAHELVGTLDHATAAVLVLRLGLGLSFEDAGAISGQPVPALKRALYRAVVKARRRLEAENEG